MTIEERIDELADLLGATLAEIERITSPVAPRLYRVPEAAAALRVDPSIVYRLIRAGELPTVTLPTMTEPRVPVAAVDALVHPDRWNTAPHLQAVADSDTITTMRKLAVEQTTGSRHPAERDHDDRIWAARKWLRANDPDFDLAAAIAAHDAALVDT